MADQKLWQDDPYLLVLYKLIVKTKQAYEACRRPGGASQRNLKRHKFTVKWLIEEISQACRTYPHWYRGRQCLGQLIDYRLEIDAYYDKVCDKPIQETMILWKTDHHHFYGTFAKLEELFSRE